MDSDVRNRRAFIRKRVQFALKLRNLTHPTESEKAPTGNYFIAREISGGGMSLETFVAIAQADEVQVEFTLPGETRKLLLNARVRWCASVRAKSTKGGAEMNLNRIGLEFLDLNQDDQRYLTNYLGGTFLLY
jgi:Tfp pilus assembly protein PilZ